ncbi:MAG: hypothetical protein KA408_02280 [Flavobacteriales bacterium]|nr:hypothetical protein [Flavobacteriales bacterium]
MRFLIEYKDTKTKDETNRNLKVLDTFLNFHLIELFHGWTFESILIRFINYPKPNKKLKCKTLYNTCAEIEIASNFDSNSEISLEQFLFAFDQVKIAVRLANEIQTGSGKDYDLPRLTQDIDSLKTPTSVEELIELENLSTNDMIRVKRVNGLINSWKENPLPHNRSLKGVRIYDQFERTDLWPFAYIYSELLSNLLRHADITTPGYQEIYFTIGKSIAEAKRDLALETWHKYTYCSLDIAQYKNSDEQVRSEMLFNSLKEGLRLIADFDHLDKKKIEEVISYIGSNGTKTELVFLSKSKGDLNAQIVHRIPDDHRKKTAYYLKLSNAKTGEAGKVKIAELDSLWAPYNLGAIKIKNYLIAIVGRKSMRAEMSREMNDLPELYEFEIDKILKTKAQQGV